MRLAKRLGLAIFSFNVAAAASEAQAQQTGVLCAYVIYSGAMLDSEVCGWDATPVGQVVRKGVADMEAHIRANSSEQVAKWRTNYAAGLSTMRALSSEERIAYCAGTAPDYPNYFGAMRFEDPKEMTEELSELLSRPGEPGYGDCF